MPTLALILFASGFLTILLPCILPLLPIVLGASIVDRNRWRPLLIIGGMLVSFVGITFLLQVALRQFSGVTELADYIRIGTYGVLLLFGLGFLTENRMVQYSGAALAGLFFVVKGWPAVVAAASIGVVAMMIGGNVASKLQQCGSDIQTTTRASFGLQSALTAFVIGLTMGLVWVPCAGPALGFALGLVRDKPGLQAFLLLSCYGLGASAPLLIVGYGGQYAARSLRSISQFSGTIKHVAGGILIASALAFQLNWFTAIQEYFVNNTSYGTLGTRIESSFFGKRFSQTNDTRRSAATGGNVSAIVVQPEIMNSGPLGDVSQIDFQWNGHAALPVFGTAPELVGLQQWFNTNPLSMAQLKGKVVLIDFWTYSCINCIRTLPYMKGYWAKYKNSNFVLIGVHAPEFAFEKSETNVAAAIARYNLPYPVVQDNDFTTWNAYSNHYWPAKYLVDAQGRVRYFHFGEGEYDVTDAAIASLIKENGMTVSSTGESSSASLTKRSGPVSPETYLNDRGAGAFGNPDGVRGKDGVMYALPSSYELDSFYLGGAWRLSGDHQLLQSKEGTIVMRFTGGEMNLVLGLDGTDQPVKADILIDGKATKAISIDRHDLFNLYSGEYGEHVMELKIHGSGVGAYAFTFGG